MANAKYQKSAGLELADGLGDEQSFGVRELDAAMRFKLISDDLAKRNFHFLLWLQKMSQVRWAVNRNTGFPEKTSRACHPDSDGQHLKPLKMILCPNPQRGFLPHGCRYFFLVLLVWNLATGTTLEAQDFKLGGARKIPPPLTGSLPNYQYSPDGHLPVFQQDSSVSMFWPFDDSYRSSGPSIFEMYDAVKVPPRGRAGSFDSGGAWLYTVLPGREGRMLGFYHAEDRTFPLSPDSNFISYKSIARCVSDDSGLTWKNREQVLTAHRPKPKRAKWSGLGDHCIVWDRVKKRLMCFFQEEGYLSMAESTDSQGRAGSWRKWHKAGFSEPGLGGRATPIPALAMHPGGNPSVLWNTFLQRWLIAWHGWGGDLWISSSTNLMDWTPPKILLKKPPGRAKAWYPTLVGISDKVGGEKLRLLYAEFPDGEKYERRFFVRQMHLKK